jgi:PilZ domain
LTTGGTPLIFAVSEVKVVGQERRKAWRTGLVLDVWYEGEGGLGETHISDLSVTGAYIETRTPLPAGVTFKLIFALPDGQVVETEAAVMHSQRGQGMGIHFTTLSLEQTNYIRQFIRA